MKTPLKELKRIDYPLEGEVINPMLGIKYDYSFSGKRIGPEGFINLYLTIRITDSTGQTFQRKSEFLGDKEGWKKVIRGAIIDFMNDVHCGNMLIKTIMREFEVDNRKYISLERYHH